MDRMTLARLLGDLEREGVLDASRRRQVEERLLPHTREPRDRTAVLVGIIAGLGAVLVGVGVLFFVASHWEDIPRAGRLALIAGFLLVVHHFGYALAEEPGRSPRTGRALTAAGVLAFGGAVALVGQMYHLESSPAGLLAWWLFGLPFVLLTCSRTVLLLVLAVFTVWLGWQAGAWFEEQTVLRGDHEVAAAAALALGDAILLLGLAAAAARTRFDALAGPLRLVAWPIALAGVYALSFEEAVDVLPERMPIPWTAFVPAVVLAACGALLLLAGLRVRGRSHLADGAAVLAVGLLLVLVMRVVPGATFVAANLVLFVGLPALAARGVREGEPAYVNYGVLGFLLLVMSRWFEYMGDRFQEGFVVFLGAGVLLLGVGLVLERKRRVLVRRAREASP